jgi:hypothetical protein
LQTIVDDNTVFFSLGKVRKSSEKRENREGKGNKEWTVQAKS